MRFLSEFLRISHSASEADSCLQGGEVEDGSDRLPEVPSASCQARSSPMSGGGLKFWKPGTAGPGSSLDRETETEGNVIQSAPAYASLSIQAQREHLPIYKHSEQGERYSSRE